MKFVSRIFAGALALAWASGAVAQNPGLAPGGSLYGNPTTSQAQPKYSQTPVLGIPGSVLGSLGLAGSSGGTVTIRPQAAAGTYNFNLPASAGTAGQPLLSAGGGASPMTFGTLGPAAGGTGIANNAANTLTWSGAFPATFAVTGITNVTFPISGTLATTAGASIPSGTTNDILSYSAPNVLTASQTLPTAVQSNITRLGTLAPTANSYNRALDVIFSSPTSGSTAGPVWYNKIAGTVRAGAPTGSGGVPGNGQFSSLMVDTTFGGPNFGGTASSGWFYLHSDQDTASGADRAAIFTLARASANDPTGYYLGINPEGWVDSGKTVRSVAGLETGTGLAGIATNRFGILIHNNQSTAKATTRDFGLAFSGVGGAPTGGEYSKLIGLTNNYGTPPVDATSDWFFSEPTVTMANWANLSNVTVSGSILSFPSMKLTGGGGLSLGTTTAAPDGGLAVGRVASSAYQFQVSNPSQGVVAALTSTNSTSGLSVLEIQNTTASSGAGTDLSLLSFEPANTSVRYGLTSGNWGMVQVSGSDTNGLVVGLPVNKPIHLAQNNTIRATVQAGLSVGLTTDPGAGIVSALTGFRVNNAAASGNVLRGDGANFVSAALAGSDITGAALTKTDDTNVTLTLGGTPTTALLRASSLTLGWTGTLAPSRGGTGVANSANLTVSSATSVGRGQYQGTNTNDDATAGNIGEYVEALATSGTSNVTISNASPGIVSWTSHGLTIQSPVVLTTTGGLPTGLSVATNYWVCSTNFTANSFALATSVDNAVAGTCINTSSAGSGTHSAQSWVLLTTGTNVNITALRLSAGDWDIRMVAAYSPQAGTTSTGLLPYLGIASATLPADLYRKAGAVIYPAGTVISGSFDPQAVVPASRFSLSAATTIYCGTLTTFATSGLRGYGSCSARRVR